MALSVPPVLEIHLGDVLVATIVSLAARDTVFTFEASYVFDDDRPILSQGFIDAYGRLKVRRGQLGRILPFFANLLPEGALRKYIADRASVDERDDLALLWITGLDLPGAVTAMDEYGTTAGPAFNEGASTHPAVDDTLLRFSLAGVQMKFSAVENLTGRMTIPVSGLEGDYIVKLPSERFPLVAENEHAMMSFARELGLEAPEFRIVDIDEIAGLPSDLRLEGSKAFVTRRFDRSDEGRIHIEDFNQIYRQYPNQKYDNRNYDEMGRDIYRWMGASALQDFVRRLVFSMAIGNTDMHLKNWSLIYRDKRTPALAPIYDYVCTSCYPVLDRDRIALALGGVRPLAQLNEGVFERFATRADLSTRLVLTAARDMRARILETWPKTRMRLREEVPIVASEIDRLLASVPFFNAK